METTKKAPMFSPHERNVLFNILMKYSSIVENKKTNATTIYQKKETWIRICKEFNAVAGVVRRDELQLKRHWDKQKAVTRKELAAQKRHALGTGGGPPRKIQVDEEVIAQVLLIQPGLDDEVESLDSDYHRAQRNNHPSAVSGSIPAPAASFPLSTTPTVLTSASAPLLHIPISPPSPIPEETFSISQLPIQTLPAFQPVPCGSSLSQPAFYLPEVPPSAEEAVDDPSSEPPSAAAELVQSQDAPVSQVVVPTTPRPRGFVERRRASNSSHVAEEVRVRLQKARGSIDHQKELESLKMEHHKRLFQLKEEKELEFQGLRIANEKERRKMEIIEREEFHKMALQHQQALNALQIQKAELELEMVRWELSQRKEEKK